MGFWRQTSNRFVDSQPRECQGWGQRREPVYLILPDQSQCQSTSRRDLMDQASWHPDASRTHGALARERRLRCDSQSILFRYSYRGGWHLEPEIWPLPLLFKGSRSHERCLAGCGPGAGQCQPWTSASRALTVSQSADKCRDARGRKRRSAGPGLARSAALYRAWPEPQRQHLTVVADLAN